MPKGAIGVNELGQYVDKNGKVLGVRGANINVPGGTQPGGNYPGGAYGGSNQTMSPFPGKISMGGKEVKANSLDVYARQLVQITNDLRQLKSATDAYTGSVQLNQRAIISVGKNYNVLARQILTISQDENVVRSTTDAYTGAIQLNQKAVISIAKNYNVLARQIVTVSKDYKTGKVTVDGFTGAVQLNQKAVISISKNYNVLARQVNQLTINFKALAKAINSVPRNVNIHVGASGPGLKFAQSGMHETLSADTLIYAHKGEKVDIGPGRRGETGSHNMNKGNGGGGVGGDTIVEIHHHHDDRTEIQRLKRRMGSGRAVFGQ